MEAENASPMLDNHWIWLLMAIGFAGVIVAGCTLVACALLAIVLRVTAALRPPAEGVPRPSSPSSSRQPRTRRRRS